MTTLTPTTVRRGKDYWVSGLSSMLRFDYLALRQALPFFLVIQIMMGAGMAIIYGFYFADLPPTAATSPVTSPLTVTEPPMATASPATLPRTTRGPPNTTASLATSSS